MSLTLCGDLPNCVVHDYVQADWPIYTATGIRNSGFGVRYLVSRTSQMPKPESPSPSSEPFG